MSGFLLDEYPLGATIYGLLHTFDSNGASITLTGLAVTDIEIYKNGSVTQRASDAGYALLDTDGIDFDTTTGIHGISIDLSDNTDAGFYAVGSYYTVVLASVTVDTRTVNLVLGSFRIMAAESVAGKPKVDVDAWLGTAAATPTVAGVPEVDVTHWIGTAAATPTTAGVPEVDVTHWLGTAAATPTTAGVPEVDITFIAGAAVSTTTAQLGVNVVNAAGTAWGSGAITAASIAAGAIDADALASDAVTEIRSLASGTSDSGTTTTMVDAVRTEADTDYWKGALIVFTSGAIAGQARVITGFNAATDTITFAPATTQAVATQTYEIWPTGDFLRPTTSGLTLDVSAGGEAGLDWANIGSPTTAVNLSATNIDVDQVVASVSGAVASVTGSVGSVTGAVGSIATGGIAAASFAAGAIDAAAIATDALGALELAAGAASEIAAAVWDLDATAHQTQGTFGQAIGDPAADSNTIYGAVVTGAAGATVAADIIAVKAETATIVADTAELQTDWVNGGRLDLILDARASQTSVDDLPTNAELATSQAAADDATLAAIAALNNLSAAQVNTEVDTALADVRLDELMAADSDIDGLAPPTVGSVFHELMTKTAGSFTYDQTTDSVEAIRDRGDAAWITATGFSTLDAAGVRTAVGLASANLDTQIGDLPTNAELATSQASADDATLAAIAALNNLSAAQVNAEVVDCLNVDTYAEPGQGAPGATISLAAKIGYIYKAWRNRHTQTASEYALYADDATTKDHEATFSDDGTTADRGEVTTGA